jgi:large subunit ribosomal protein L31
LVVGRGCSFRPSQALAPTAARRVSLRAIDDSEQFDTQHFEEVLMKSDIHPDYAPVVFRDLASGATFLTRSTVSSEKTIEWEDGNTYPVIDVEISSASHPFYTGKQRILDSAGRVEKFNQRFKNFGK